MSASTHSIKHIALTAICAAVLAACGGGGSGGASNSLNTNVVENATAARSVMDDIEALPEAEELTAEQLSAVAAAQQRYNNLSDSQKLMVAQTSTDKLQALLEAAESAAASAVSVSQEIASLPASSKLTAADDDEISQARTSYDALTDNEKSWVSDESLAKLVAAEQTAAANKTAAEAWAATAQALTAASSLSKSDEAGVNAVQAAYNNLTAAQQSYLAAADTVELQSRLAAVAENKQLAADFAAAVAALPTASSLNESNDDSVGNVRDAYEALSTSEKTWVSEASLTQLSLAEQTIADNKTAAATWAATAQALTAASSLSKSDEAGVNAVQAAYNNLTAAQQSYLAAADTAELQSRLAAVAENKQLAADFAAAVAALPQNGLDIDTAEEEKALETVKAAYDALSDSEKTWVDAAVLQALNTIDQTAIIDNDSLAELNLPTPLHTSFISSSTAQQNNPHMQLRTVDGESALVDTQIGLVRSLILNPNDAVVIDGAVLTNSATSPATEVSYLTPHSAITKASSAGTTQEDISAMYGETRGVYSIVKTTLDGEIQSNYDAIQEAETALKDSESDAEAIAEAQETIAKLTPLYESDLVQREALESKAANTLAGITYIKKDKNGLVFDKAFDGVYVLEFANGVSMVLHDPAAAGWTYQTFVHYTDTANGITHGYQSLGDETTVASMPTSGTATYNGITTAYLTGGSADQQLTANVTAVADFAKKGVRFQTSGSQIHELQSGVRVSNAAAQYDMSGKATWSSNSNTFKGSVNTTDQAMSGTLNGKFFGTSAAEIGGTYGLANADNSLQLIGGYGAKRK